MPPEPKRGPRFGPDAECYLCGGDTGGAGWHLKDAIGVSFTDVTQAQMPESKTMCQSCVAISKAEGWAQYVAAHPERGLSATFPAKEGKEPRALNWLYQSHLFVSPDHHECPNRGRWRELLLCPPDPPFLAVVAVSGKKQLIFKSRIAYSRDRFPVQMEDDLVTVMPTEFAVALEDFERLYLMGFSKDSILSSDYHPKTLMDVGISRWRAAHELTIEWRRNHPDLWRLCHFVSQRPEGWTPLARESIADQDSQKPEPQLPAQGVLF